MVVIIWRGWRRNGRAGHHDLGRVVQYLAKTPGAALPNHVMELGPWLLALLPSPCTQDSGEDFLGPLRQAQAGMKPGNYSASYGIPSKLRDRASR